MSSRHPGKLEGVPGQGETFHPKEIGSPWKPEEAIEPKPEFLARLDEILGEGSTSYSQELTPDGWAVTTSEVPREEAVTESSPFGVSVKDQENQPISAKGTVFDKEVQKPAVGVTSSVEVGGQGKREHTG